MKTSSFVSPRRLALGAVVSASLFILGTAVRAELPAGGNGWTLAGTDNAWTLHSDIEGAQAYSGAANNYSWTYETNGTFNGGTQQDIAGNPLTPTSGSKFYVASIGTTVNTGIAIVFNGVKATAGTYTVTFDIAGINGKTFLAPGYLNLTADLDENGFYSYSERMGATTTNQPSPSAGGWQTWTYTFNVTDQTLVGSSLAVGHDLGFVILGSAANTGFAFDNLNVSFTASAIPEPATFAVTAGAVFLFIAWGWRRKFGTA